MSSIRPPHRPAAVLRGPAQPALSIKPPHRPAAVLRGPAQPALSIKPPHRPAAVLRGPAQPALSINVPTPIGAMRVDVRDERIVAVYLPNRAPDDRPAAGGGTARDARVLTAAAKQLTEYFAGKRHVFDLPLETGGTPFQQRVWCALLAIPFGETCSYGDIARAIDASVSASRAVGAANGANPIAIVVPCHRVIGASGKLVGYGGGLPAKQWLLAHERTAVQPQLDLDGGHRPRPTVS